jgi:hypothetical protein
VRTITTNKFREATSEAGVVQLVREYFRDWSPREYAQLPPDCRPGKIRDCEDLNDLALNLARACVSFDVEPGQIRLIEEMDAFIGQACHRLAEIQRRVPDYAPHFSSSAHS